MHLPRSACGSVPAFGGAREPDQHSGWDGTEETTSKQEKLVKKMEPVSCLDLVCGGGDHFCDGRSCVRILSFEKEDLATWFSDITEKERW